MLYYPWYDEDTDLLGSFTTYEQDYNNVRSIVIANEAKFSISDVEDIDFDLGGQPEHLWDPSTEDSRLRSNEEGSELLTDVSEQDLVDNSSILGTGSSAAVQGRYENAANKEEISPQEYRQLLRQLNAKQRAIVMYHRNWCKKGVIALRNNTHITPYRVSIHEGV